MSLAFDSTQSAYEQLAEVYDCWLSGDPAAAPCLGYYIERLRGEKGPLLELGCGTGRISVGLAAAGQRVLGVDCSHLMLRLAEKRLAATAIPPGGGARFAEARFERLPAEAQSFGAVLLPMRTVGHLDTDPEVRACFSEAARVLRPGGLLLLDHYVFDRNWAEAHDGLRRLMYAGADPRVEGSLLIWDRYDYEFDRRFLRATVFLEQIESGAHEPTVRKVGFDFRWFDAEELIALAESAGLRLDSLHGGFDGRPFDEEGEDIVLCLRKSKER